MTLLNPVSGKKHIALDPKFEREVADAAGCTVHMVRHVMRRGLGQASKARPERLAAYRELQLRGKLP